MFGLGRNKSVIYDYCTRRRISREFRLNANIGDFKMGDVILDLGSKVNVLPKKTRQCMGEPTL